MKNEESILLLGDWFIDEYWIVDKINSYHSSHTGDLHFGIKQNKTTNGVIYYCGIPEVLEIFNEYNYYIEKKAKANTKSKTKLLENITSIGNWNPIDNSIIDCLLCPKSKDKQFLTQFTVKSLSEKEVGSELCLYKDEPCKKNTKCFNIIKDQFTEDTSTNKIVRCYDGFGSDNPHNINRIDWIISLKDEYKRNIADILPERDGNKLIHIVIEDHGMGVVSEKTIVELFKYYSNIETKWYIRTKLDNPNWLSRLVNEIQNCENPKKHTIDTIVNDFKISNRKQGVREPWYGETISRSSLELLGSMIGLPIYKHQKKQIGRYVEIAENAAILLDDNSIIGIEKTKKDNSNDTEYTCFLFDNSKESQQKLTIGRTRKFFAASIIKRILQPKTKPFHDICNEASNFAYHWAKILSSKWKDREEDVFDYSKTIRKMFDLKQDIDVFENKLNLSEPPKSEYYSIWEDWNNSSLLLGINKNGFQLWRSFSSLKKYITVGGEKRDEINNLINEIDNFCLNQNPNHSLSSLIISSPGWGKSFLAKCIAEKFNLEFLEFSISQMATTKDLIGCFATISSIQSRNKNKKLLVFIDEINAEVEGNLITPLLLNPIWDGVFYNEGRSFRIDPCVWLFASTSDSSEANKGSDFKSRLNGPIIELDKLGAGNSFELIKKLKSLINKISIYDYRTIYKTLIKHGNLNSINNSDLKSTYSDIIKSYIQYCNSRSKMKTEQVYIMINYLNTLFGPILKVEKRVMWLFYNVFPINGIRSLKFFADRFLDIKDGIVNYKCVPNFENNDVLNRNIIIPIEWFSQEKRDSNFGGKKDLIDIEINPR